MFRREVVEYVDGEFGEVIRDNRISFKSIYCLYIVFAVIVSLLLLAMKFYSDIVRTYNTDDWVIVNSPTEGKFSYDFFTAIPDNSIISYPSVFHIKNESLGINSYIKINTDSFLIFLEKNNEYVDKGQVVVIYRRSSFKVI